MKTYTLWIQRYNYSEKIESNNKHNAIIAIRRKLGLSWLDNIVCLGINL